MWRSVVPSPRRRMVNRVVCRALRSSSSSLRRSWSSYSSGATTSSTLRPRMRSRFGPKWPASAIRWASAFARISGSRSGGSASSAAVITRACSTLTRPELNASRSRRHRDSSDSASRPAAAIGPRAPRTWWASHDAADLIPASSATSSAPARTRSRRPCNRSASRDSSTNASAFAGVGMVIGSTSATRSSASPISAAHLSTG